MLTNIISQSTFRQFSEMGIISNPGFGARNIPLLRKLAGEA